MSTGANQAERNKKLAEISYYKSNNLSYKMVLFAVLAEMIYVITVLGQVEINALVGLITMVNIVLLFLLFTIAIKVNVYSQFWTNIGFATTGYLALRAAVLLPMLVKPLGSYTAIYGMTAISIALVLFGCIISQKRIALREQAKEAMGK